MCDFDYDPPSAFRQVDRKARKAHRCCECSRTILPGEVYEYTSGIWDGAASSYKTCSFCVALKSYYSTSDCYPVFTGLAEHLDEHGIDPFVPDAMDRWRMQYPPVIGPRVVLHADAVAHA